MIPAFKCTNITKSHAIWEAERKLDTALKIEEQNNNWKKADSANKKNWNQIQPTWKAGEPVKSFNLRNMSKYLRINYSLMRRIRPDQANGSVMTGTERQSQRKVPRYMEQGRKRNRKGRERKKRQKRPLEGAPGHFCASASAGPASTAETSWQIWRSPSGPDGSSAASLFIKYHYS